MTKVARVSSSKAARRLAPVSSATLGQSRLSWPSLGHASRAVSRLFARVLERLPHLTSSGVSDALTHALTQLGLSAAFGLATASVGAAKATRCGPPLRMAGMRVPLLEAYLVTVGRTNRVEASHR